MEIFEITTPEDLTYYLNQANDLDKSELLSLLTTPLILNMRPSDDENKLVILLSTLKTIGKKFPLISSQEWLLTKNDNNRTEISEFCKKIIITLYLSNNYSMAQRLEVNRILSHHFDPFLYLTIPIVNINFLNFLFKKIYNVDNYNKEAFKEALSEYIYELTHYSLHSNKDCIGDFLTNTFKDDLFIQNLIIQNIIIVESLKQSNVLSYQFVFDRIYETTNYQIKILDSFKYDDNRIQLSNVEIFKKFFNFANNNKIKISPPLFEDINLLFLDLYENLALSGEDINFILLAYFKIFSNFQHDNISFSLKSLITKYLNHPNFNINHKDLNDDRLIDLVNELYDLYIEFHFDKTDDIKEIIEVIQLLRFSGSAEPKNQIGEYNKIDLTKGLDSYDPNIFNALKILKILNNNFLPSEEIIDQEITELKDELKTENNEAFINKYNVDPIPTEWGTEGNNLTLIEVIEKLSSMTKVKDRMEENNKKVYWSFKNVLGTILHIAKIKNSEELKNNLIHCLVQLKMCDLGKLINLLHVVQDFVIEEKVNNFNEFNDYKDLLNSFLETFFYNENLNSKKIDITLSTGLMRWLTDINCKTDPEQWHPSSILIQGKLNEVFVKFMNEKLNCEIFDSKYFKDLQQDIIQPFIELLNNKNAHHPIKEKFESILKVGKNNLASLLFDKIIKSDSDQAEELIKNICFNPEFFFGDLEEIDINVIFDFHFKLNHRKDTVKLLTLCKENLIINKLTEDRFDFYIHKENGYINSQLHDIFKNDSELNISNYDAKMDDYTHEIFNEFMNLGHNVFNDFSPNNQLVSVNDFIDVDVPQIAWNCSLDSDADMDLF